MQQKFIRDDFEKFHDYQCLIPDRIIYFGSEWDDGEEEGGVDSQSAKFLIKNLIYLDRLEKAPITIYWNSPGGCWFRGMAIYDVILGLRSKVNMIGFGMVRSMGTIIMQACYERLLAPNCDFLIHEGIDGYYGIPKDFRSWAKYSEYSSNKMYDIYLDKIREKHPKYKKETIKELCTTDCILIGEEAIKLGLADKVLK